MSKLKRETLRGVPIHVGDHEIILEARVWSWQTKEAVIRDAHHAYERGLLIAQARPTALLDRVAGKTYRVPIVDRNRQLEVVLLSAAIALPIILNTAAALLRSARRA